MSWIQLLLAVPLALVAVALVHDFMAGLGEERLWGRPFDEDLDPWSAPKTRSPGPGIPAPEAQLKKVG